MSMPLRFEPSENPAMTLPDVGHAQSSLASSISGTRADSAREDGAAFATVVAVPEGGATGGALGDEGAAAGGEDGLAGVAACGVAGVETLGTGGRSSCASA